MRLLVSTTAGSGHFGPLVPFARACAAAGHEVAVTAPESFAAAVAAAGFEHLPFADAPPELLGQVFARVPSLSFEEANDVVVSEVFGRLDARAALPGVRQAVETWRPDVILREPCEFGSLVAALAAGVPLVAGAIGVRATTGYLAPLVAAPLAELESTVGLPAGSAAGALASTPTLTCVPAVLDDAGPPEVPGAAPVHRFRDEAPGVKADGLPETWGDPDQPLVYVTFGSVAGALGDFAGVYPAVLQAFADRPVRLLLTTGEGVDPAVLGPLPPNAHVERWWPQADVMPRAAAMVGHGGFGTTMAALAAGVPQVVVPLFAFDQRINGEHVAAVGAGITLAGGPAALEHAPDAVAQLLAEPSYPRAARAVADAMAALPPVSSSVDLVERIASG